jgi:hypothetical protein
MGIWGKALGRCLTPYAYRLSEFLGHHFLQFLTFELILSEINRLVTPSTIYIAKDSPKSTDAPSEI